MRKLLFIGGCVDGQVLEIGKVGYIIMHPSGVENNFEPPSHYNLCEIKCGQEYGEFMILANIESQAIEILLDAYKELRRKPKSLSPAKPFEVKEKVYDSDYGNGEIISITATRFAAEAVKVKFEGGFTEHYTLKGQIRAKANYPHLFRGHLTACSPGVSEVEDETEF